jgi:glutaredoxin
MRKLIVVILIVAGIWYWQKHHHKQVVLDASGNPAVLIYTAKDCGAPCQDALNILNARGVPYQEKEIDPSNEQDEDAKQWRRVGDNMLPLTLLGSSIVKGSSKWELIGLLGENFGDKYLTQDEKVYFSQHFDASGKPNVVLYGTAWCPGCAALRKDFQEHSVSFVDIDVEKSGEFDKLTRVMDIPGYPATWVGYTRVPGTTFNDVKVVMNK